MKKKDIGFVLSRISYSETSSIIKCFTRENGLKTFLIQGGKKKYSFMLQAYTPIEFTFYQKREELAKMYDPSLLVSLNEVLFNPIKSGFLFFQAEIILQCLKEGQTDENLFRFMMNELLWLKELEQQANYLLCWMLEFTNIQGFKPYVLEEGTCFDLINGEISRQSKEHNQCVHHPDILILIELLEKDKKEAMSLKITKESRKFLLFLLIDYLKIHISDFHVPKSLEVYQTIWYD